MKKIYVIVSIILLNLFSQIQIFADESRFEFDSERDRYFDYSMTPQGSRFSVKETNNAEFKKGSKYYIVLKNSDADEILNHQLLISKQWGSNKSLITISKGDLEIKNFKIYYFDKNFNELGFFDDVNDNKIFKMIEDNEDIVYTGFGFEIEKESTISSTIMIENLGTYPVHFKREQLEHGTNYDLFLLEKDITSGIIKTVASGPYFMYVYTGIDEWLLNTNTYSDEEIKKIYSEDRIDLFYKYDDIRFGEYEDVKVTFENGYGFYLRNGNKLKIKSSILYDKKMINLREFLRERAFYTPEYLSYDSKNKIIKFISKDTKMFININTGLVQIYNYDSNYDIDDEDPMRLIKEKTFDKKHFLLYQDSYYVSPEVFEFILTK